MTTAPVRDPLADHLLTAENAALLLIDYQPAQLAGVRRMDRDLLVKNAVSAVRAVKTFDVPVVHSTVNVGTDRGQPTLPDLAGRLSTGPPPPASRKFWPSPRSDDPAAAWRPATCSPPPSNPPKHHRSPGTGALDYERRLHASGPDPRRHALVLGLRGLPAQGRWDWAHLRVCQERGHVGCCDNSPGRHATAHFRSAGHAVMRSYEPGEDWYWCYVDQFAFELVSAPPAPSHP